MYARAFSRSSNLRRLEIQRRNENRVFEKGWGGEEGEKRNPDEKIRAPADEIESKLRSSKRETGPRPCIHCRHIYLATRQAGLQPRA